jgi:competence protein ComGC
MKNKGFTFIEMLVVITATLIIIPSLFTIVFSIVRSQTKIFKITQAKKEGDYLLNVITTTIRNRAISIHSGQPVSETNKVCRDISDTTPYEGTAIYFNDDTNKWFGFLLENSKVASASQVISGNQYLTSNNTIVQNFSVACRAGAAYSYATVGILFDICYKTSTGTCYSLRSEDSAILHYQTQVRLRNTY